LLITSLSLLLFFFHRSAHHRDLHSFPTRRSSDLEHADEVKRLEFLMTQRDDLLAARNSLQQAAREIDQTAKQLFLDAFGKVRERSEEHTSELQSRFDLVCRLLLEKKKTNKNKLTS